MKIKNDIVQYFHCSKCLEELPEDRSPSDYQRVNVGWTKKGLQIWCTRHDENIIHLDFKEQKVAVA